MIAGKWAAGEDHLTADGEDHFTATGEDHLTVVPANAGTHLDLGFE